MEGANGARQDDKDSALKRAMFHDFLGPKSARTDANVIYKAVDASPSASLSHGGASSGNLRLPISSTSDPASSERQHHLEGIPYYGPRDEFSFVDACKRMQKNKRSSSDSAFTGMGNESIESLHMKMFKYNGGRRAHEEEGYYNNQPMRPASGTLIVHPSAGARSVPMGTYPSRGNQIPSQVSPNRFKNNPSVDISHTAADEGSRTGMKTPGILATANPTDISKVETESLCPSRQMTIFYNGQAHVFDDVHPNKADVIMSLAGSNGGSWSTTYSPKQIRRTAEEPESGTAMAGAAQMRRGRLSIVNNASGDSIASPSDMRNVKGVEYCVEDKDKFKLEMKGI